MKGNFLKRSILRSIVKDVFAAFDSFYLPVIEHVNLIGEKSKSY